MHGFILFVLLPRDGYNQEGGGCPKFCNSKFVIRCTILEVPFLFHVPLKIVKFLPILYTYIIYIEEQNILPFFIRGVRKIAFYLEFCP